MLKEFEKNKKTLVIFIKRCMKYFSILIILVLMILPLFFKSYTLAKQLTLDNSSIKLKEGMDSLTSQITKSYEIASLLRQEGEFKRLFFLKGAPSSEYYPDIATLQTKLRGLSLTQDLFSNVYILFKDNPIFISNYISSDDYSDVYERYFRYQDISVEQWRDLMFEESFSEKILPASSVYSSYYQNNEFEGITAIMNNSYYNGIDQESVLGVVFNKEDIMNKILFEDQFDDHFAYLVDQHNNILMSHNYEESEALEGINNLSEISLSSENYIVLTYKSDVLGLQTVVGIPLHVFQGNVNVLLELVMLYVAVGALIILLLSLYFSMKETMWLKKLVEVAAKSTNTVFNTRNEYSYIKNAFTKISTMNEEQFKRIEKLNRSMKYSVLKHLLTLGVHTDTEINEAKSYFKNQFDNFCIVKVSYTLDESYPVTKSIQQNIILEIENTVEGLINHEYVSLHFSSNECTLVVFFDSDDDSEINLLKAQLSKLIRAMNASSPIAFKTNIGLSHMMSGIKNAKSAYQQAIYALSTNENDLSSGVYIYEPRQGNTGKLVFDITILLKLYDALIAGEKSIVKQIFSDSAQDFTNYPLTEQEQLQIFFSFRQTVYNAHNVIVNEKYKSDEQFNLSIPEYGQFYDFVKLMSELKHVSLNLCEFVMSNRKSNNEKLKVDIVEFIKHNYAELSLSASSIAAQLLISEKYVFSFVKEQTGKSLGKFIEEIRITNAERLLLETDFPNSKILTLCGFGSENTFYRAFNKKHVVSPTVWRENHKNHTK